MTISPLGMTGGVVAPMPTMPTVPTVGDASSTGAMQSAGGADFGTSLASAVDALSMKNQKVNELAMQAATGTLRDPSDFLIAQTEASLNTQLMSTFRTKALESFNEIMRMPV